MPVTLLKDAVSDRLACVGFRREKLSDIPDPGDILKERILTGDKLEIDIFSEDKFMVTISEQQYSRIVSASYWYSLHKIKEQRKLICSHSVKDIPIAWLLITAYYSSFYSAIELSRLFGLYNLNLSGEQCRAVVSQTTFKETLQSGTYLGGVDFESSGEVKITFSRQEKVKPHELAWKNMTSVLKFNNRNKLLDKKVKKFDLLNEIFNMQKRKLKMPNNIRNEWNYSIPNSYDPLFCQEVESIYEYIGLEGSRDILNWANTNKKMNGKQNSVFSIFYIEIILFQTLLDMKSKILDDCNISN